jgi:hypothetical protein
MQETPRIGAKVPVRKVQVAALAGALVTVVVAAVNASVMPKGHPIDATTAAALTTLFAFVLSYLTPPENQLP